MYLTIPEFLNRTLTRFPDRPAIRNTREKPQESNEVTFRELDQISSKLAVGLARMGITKGDKVAIMSRPRIRFAASLLAIMRLGGWVIPLDPTLTSSEVKSILDRAVVVRVHCEGSGVDGEKKGSCQAEDVMPGGYREEGILFRDRHHLNAPFDIGGDVTVA